MLLLLLLLLLLFVLPGGSRVGRGGAGPIFGSCGLRSEQLCLREGTVARVLSTLGAQNASHRLLNCKKLFRTQATAPSRRQSCSECKPQLPKRGRHPRDPPSRRCTRATHPPRATHPGDSPTPGDPPGRPTPPAPLTPIGKGRDVGIVSVFTYFLKIILKPNKWGRVAP